MTYASKQIVVFGWLCAAIAGSGGCEPRRTPSTTVSGLMEDRVTLDGVLMKCNQDLAKARTDADCLNARVAIERLANDVGIAEEAKHSADFEHSRDRLRLAEEKMRADQAARAKVDAYNLPMVPEDAPPQLKP